MPSVSLSKVNLTGKGALRPAFLLGKAAQFEALSDANVHGQEVYSII